MFDDLFQMLANGFSLEKKTYYRSALITGRSSNEVRTTISLREKGVSKDIMDVTFFSGIKPWYHPWIEITYPYEMITNENVDTFCYFGSSTEQSFIKLFCNSLPPAGKIFVSYDSDDETRKGLMVNIPEIITRLGFLLFNNGCTWFKDWYFPEGGNEGGQKLQGEKPVNSIKKVNQVKKLHQEVDQYLTLNRAEQTISSIEKNAIQRARKVLNQLD